MESLNPVVLNSIRAVRVERVDDEVWLRTAERDWCLDRNHAVLLAQLLLGAVSEIDRESQWSR